MRTSATGRSEAGFTLLELLVVLVIIGIATTVIALRPDPRAAVREEGDRLAVLFGLASEETATTGMAMAWVGRDGGYEFQTRELSDSGPDWTVASSDDLLHPRQLPGGMSIRSIQVDGKPLELGQRVGLGGVHDISLEITTGTASATISGTAGHFQSTLAAGEGA
jgi:general secretion pathway protein H